MPKEIQTSFARLQENKACLMSSASVWHIGQLTALVICLFAKITWHGIQPSSARHAKNFTMLGMESFQSFFHTEFEPDPPADDAIGLDPNLDVH